MNKLITSGFPRSGNYFLKYSLSALYEPKYQISGVQHTTKSFIKNNLTLVPFRNPLDSIASWQIFESKGSLSDDVNFYIRFYSAILENLEKIILLDFDSFTKNFIYIENKLFDTLQILANENVTDVQVKENMLEDGYQLNLPRNNKEELALVKEQLQNTAGFNQCLKLYAQLKE